MNSFIHYIAKFHIYNCFDRFMLPKFFENPFNFFRVHSKSFSKHFSVQRFLQILITKRLSTKKSILPLLLYWHTDFDRFGNYRSKH